MSTEGCRDHATHIEECMGCNGGKWNPDAADELIEAGYAVGITAAALRVAKAEIERLRNEVESITGAARSRAEHARLLAGENSRLRAAQSADAGRVRSVVCEAVTYVYDTPVPTVDVIADRVASQLGPPTMNADEREQLASLRREAIADDYPAAVAWLDRLLGATGTKP